MYTKQFILHVSLIEGIGPATVAAIASIQDFATTDCYSLSADEWIQRAGLSASRALKLVRGLANRRLLDVELELIERHNIQWAVATESSYPLSLAAIHAPPPIIYWQGAAPKNDACAVAIVGSRHATRYAQAFIDAVVPVLVQHQMVIVSGGAIGADTMAHEATLNAKGKTIVVLGSGLLQPYPLSNKKLFDRVLQNGGTILSSFPLNTTAAPGNFPARNRIIAGLSRGCVVVQAAARSGAAITARFALEQGREVCALPGPYTDELSVGCHMLIKSGATLVTSATDILHAFNIDMIATSKPHDSVHSDKDALSVQYVHSQEHTVQDRIIALCQHPQTTDELCESLDIDLIELQRLLCELQLQGQLYQMMSGQWHSSCR